MHMCIVSRVSCFRLRTKGLSVANGKTSMCVLCCQGGYLRLYFAGYRMLSNCYLIDTLLKLEIKIQLHPKTRILLCVTVDPIFSVRQHAPSINRIFIFTFICPMKWSGNFCTINNSNNKSVVKCAS